MNNAERVRKIEAILLVLHEPEPDEGWPEGPPTPTQAIEQIRIIIGEEK